MPADPRLCEACQIGAPCQAADLRLSEIGGCRPLWAWSPLSWAECHECGAANVYAPSDDEDDVYGDDPAACLGCGAVGSCRVADDGGGWVVWSGERLRPSALAGFRRLLGRPRATWWQA